MTSIAARLRIDQRFDRVREFRRSWRPQPDIYDSVIVATLRNVIIAAKDQNDREQEMIASQSFAGYGTGATKITLHPLIMFMPALCLFLLQATYLIGLAFALDPSERWIERHWEEWEHDTYSQLLLIVKFAMFLTLQVLNLDELLISLYGLHVVLNPCTLRNYVSESNRRWAESRLHTDMVGKQNRELLLFFVKWALCCFSKVMQFTIAVMALYMSANVVLVAKSVESVIFNGLVLQFITDLDEGTFSFVANSLNIDRKHYDRWEPREPPPPRGRPSEVICFCCRRRNNRAGPQANHQLLATEPDSETNELQDTNDNPDEPDNRPEEPHRLYLEDAFKRNCGCFMKAGFKRFALCASEVRDILIFLLIVFVYCYQVFDFLLAIETGVLPAVRQLCVLVRVRQRTLTGVAYNIRYLCSKVIVYLLDAATPFVDLTTQTVRLENITFANMPPYENRTFRWRCEHAEPPLSNDYPLVHRFYSMLGVEEVKFLLIQHPLKIIGVVVILISIFVMPMLTILCVPEKLWKPGPYRDAHHGDVVTVDPVLEKAVEEVLQLKLGDGVASTGIQNFATLRTGSGGGQASTSLRSYGARHVAPIPGTGRPQARGLESAP